MTLVFRFSFLILILFTGKLHAQFTNVIIDNGTKANEPSIVVNPLNTSEVAAGANFRNYYYSTDAGATWTKNLLYSTLGQQGDPCLVSDSAGHFFYLHLASTLDRVVTQKSSDGGMSYNDGAYTWDSPPGGELEDKEWGTIDPITKNIYVTWTEYDHGFSPGPTDSSRVLFSKSTDGGNTFSPVTKLNKINGDCLWVDITDSHPFTGPNGELYVTFMDSTGIRFTKSTDYGNTWLPEPMLIENGGAYRYYSLSGVNRIRSMPYNACDRSNSPYRGNLYVSWADQRNGSTNTDVFFIRSVDGGTSWTAPVKIGNDENSRHQFRNAITVDQANGYVYIVYYDRRNYTDDSTDVYLSKSTDGGNTWIDYKISSKGFISSGTPFDGDYIDITAFNGVVRPIWTRIDTTSSSVWTCLYNEGTSGVNELTASESFTVNPNPSDVVAVVSFNREMENTDGMITDVKGRTLSTFHINQEREKTLDVTGLASGIYFVRVGLQSKKLIVAK